MRVVAVRVVRFFVFVFINTYGYAAMLGQNASSIYAIRAETKLLNLCSDLRLGSIDIRERRRMAFGGNDVISGADRPPSRRGERVLKVANLKRWRWRAKETGAFGQVQLLGPQPQRITPWWLY